jgi:hypothetical protein
MKSVSFKRLLLPSLIFGGIAFGFSFDKLRASFSPSNLMVQADVIVGDLYDPESHGTLGTQSSFSFGTVSCNIGDAELTWTSFNNQHPVISTNLYRLKDGRLEHLGMNWVKHGFLALDQSLCDSCQASGGSTLGIGCSDPYSAYLNGFQADLGARSEINPVTGYFPFPPQLNPPYQGRLARRVIVDNDDIDPSLNAGARYFAEGQYITPDDCAALGNAHNNVSWREVVFTPNGNGFDIDFIGSTRRMQSVVQAWARADGGVKISENIWPNDGSIFVGSRATPQANGQWLYSYTVYNRDSEIGVRAFGVPVRQPLQITDRRFHDVDYHSGEVFNTTDWFEYDGNYPGTNQRVMAWVGGDYSNNPNANAIRWGTSYTFSFVANTAPKKGNVAIFSFKPGAPLYTFVEAHVPQ